MNRSAIVVGASSMLGRRLIQLLNQQGFHVVSCGRGVDADIYLDLAADEIQLPPYSIEADLLFHCAASFFGDDLNGARKNEKINALGSLSVAKIAKASGCKQVVYASSLFCYPHPTTAAIGSYGNSKKRGEELMTWAADQIGFSSCSLRLPQLYDEFGESFQHQPWFRRIMAYAHFGCDLALPPTPFKQNFMHVCDAAELMLAAAKQSLSGIWPAMHPVSTSYRDIAIMAYELFAKGGCVVEDVTKRPFTEHTIPDSSALYLALRFSPRVSMRDGIAHLKTHCTAARYGALDVN